MRVWILTVGEPLPTDEGNPRLLRSGILASLLQKYGCHVVWWTSSFDHQAKQFRVQGSITDVASLGYEIKQLKGCGYVHNISIRRILDHMLVASEFSRQALGEPAPDVIVASYPTIELCDAAIAFGKKRRIPVIIDIRDLWPDIFINIVPFCLQKIFRFLLYPFMHASRRVCENATAIIGITDAFVDWGVRRAHRIRCDMDQAFPLAYDSRPIDDASLLNARSQWDALGITTNQSNVCFFGTLGDQFDIPTLIAVAKLIKDTSLKIVVCGTGERIEEYRKMSVDLPQITFVGWVDAPAIRTLMERSIAGLAPYYNEMSFTLSVPNKIIEYLSGGLPIVSTLQGEVEKILNINECGITVPEKDARALADALRSLLTDTDIRTKMAARARDLFESRFVAEFVYGRLADYLYQIVKREVSPKI